tara:strand:- start:178 stop:300 length:123 start_codon:yes stop_codon:yes gene_type:complete
MGDNFVLGNLGEMDCNEEKPFIIPSKFFKEQRPFYFGLGA